MDTDISRLWVVLKQEGTALSGRAYTGYRNPDGSQWVEPYGMTVSGTVQGEKATFNVPLELYGSPNTHTFTATKTSTGLSGTWITSFKSGGNFTAIPWK